MNTKIGLIGAGGFGKSHLKALREWGSENKLQLKAVADPTDLDEESLGLIEASGARRYQDYREMFKEEDLDGVIISTPVPLHYAMTRDALEAGYTVYLEKPPVPLYSQLEELIALDRRRRVTVGFGGISWPGNHALKKVILEGRVGKLIEIRVAVAWPRGTNYYQRGSGWGGQIEQNGRPVLDGPATNAQAHRVQLACYLAGPTFDEFAQPTTIRAEFYRSRPIPSYDTAFLEGELPGGARLKLFHTHAYAGPQRTQLRVVGESGTIEVTNDEGMVCDDAALHDELQAAVREAGRCAPAQFAQRDYAALLRNPNGRPRVALADCLGFTSLINAGLISSGGIHQVPDEIITIKEGTNGELYHTEGLSEAMDKLLAEGTPLREQSLPWVVSGEPVPAEESRKLSLDFFKAPAA